MTVNRRNFMKASLGAAAGAAVLPSLRPRSTWAQPKGANDDIRIAVVGFHGKGAQHIRIFNGIEGVRIVALCDADQAVIDREKKKFDDANKKVDTYQDVRKLLEDDSIDAIVSATPNHWHSLVSVWAMQAGKDVYIEKPVCHEIWEGRKMVDAARKYNRICQAGTQSRSIGGLAECIKWMHEGHIGKIKLIRGFCYKPRPSIGKVDGPQPIPETVDYNMWTGPAPMKPLMRKSLHYDWHWVWDTGNGDIGNQGIHQMDICRWALGEDKLARGSMSVGGRFGYDDDGETPNTQFVYLDYETAPIIFEVRGLPSLKGGKAMPNYRGIRIGNVFECEGGYIADEIVYDNSGKKIKEFDHGGAGEHQQNFINAVRSRKPSDLNAEILDGYLSSALCHMGNISHLVGQTAAPPEIVERIEDNPYMMETYGRFSEHLASAGVNINSDHPTLGPSLQMDPDKERFVGEFAEEANQLLKRDYREPFVVPDKV